MISFWVPGKPQAQGSKVSTRWGMREANKELGPWRERVVLAAHQALPEGVSLILGPVDMALEFVLYRPTSTPKSRTPPAIKAPDLDKLTRGVFDALTGVVFKDDAQVVRLTAWKRVAGIGEQMGVSVSVRLLDS